MSETSATPPDLDVVTVGNAIVDVLTHATEDFLADQALVKGAMQLIETDQAERLYAAMGPGIEESGGSAANTAVGVASLGGRAGFVGKVRDDQLGDVFAHDIRAAGVEFDVAPATDGPPSARCLILVTPDAQRTLNTNLGIAGQVSPEDIDAAFISRGAVCYTEGYLWDAPVAMAAVTKAMEVAHAAGRTVAFTLSDPFCVERHRDEFVDLIERVDVVFANEVEICSLWQVGSFDEAVERVRRQDRIWALTRSEKGSVIVNRDTTIEVPAEPIDELVDTTGAGDLYAAGFLFGLTRGRDLTTCARLGSIAAAEVISHVGARPVTPLNELVSDLV